MNPMSQDETEAIAATFSPCCEFDLTPKQTVAIGDRPDGADILVGSVQRHTYPQAPTYFFRGRWMTGSQAQRLRAAAKIKTKRKTK
ncbi:MAG: hypothetical protein ACI9R3_004466, partial [Verrucomicrobiales bacterium]